MASSDLETQAKEAFIADHFELAADLYSQAIALSPNNPELFADRAQANIKLQNFTEAVADANKAIELDPKISIAYLRKGVRIPDIWKAGLITNFANNKLEDAIPVTLRKQNTSSFSAMAMVRGKV